MRYAPVLAAVLASACAGPALADIPEIVACADQPDAKLRLACFDAAVVKLKADVVESQTRKLSLFGFNLPFVGEDAAKSAEPVLGPPEINAISSKVRAWTMSQVGHTIITLDNGQVWKVNESRSIPAGTNTQVTIIRNIMGGYYMSFNDQHNDLPVTRLK